MTPLCVALIRIGFAVLGQEDSSALPSYPEDGSAYGSAYSAPVCVPCCSPTSPAPSTTPAWRAVASPAPPPGNNFHPFPYAQLPSAPMPPGPSLRGDAAVVAELIQVLNDTPSKETFCLTVQVLPSFKGEGKQALAAVLRNAERLGISRGMLKKSGKLTREQEILTDALRALSEGRNEIRPAGIPAGSAPVVPVTPAASAPPAGAPGPQTPLQQQSWQEQQQQWEEQFRETVRFEHHFYGSCR